MSSQAGAGYPASTATANDIAQRHPLLDKSTFDKLHRNSIIETQPHILHFGGFQIHKEHCHVLRIINIAASSKRVYVIGPSTPYFRIEHNSKGFLAPGMSEEITVMFTPHEWRYHYDTIKVFCGEGSDNLLVPIHAYPSTNSIALPRIIDFGSVAIGTKRAKVLPLSCKVPLHFEFNILVLDAHPDFHISPLEGVIPPDGAVNVTITFLPSKHRTARMEIQVNSAPFDCEPMQITVVGSSAPNVARNELMQQHRAELAATASVQDGQTLATRMTSMRNMKDRDVIGVRMPAFAADAAERMVDDVLVPVACTDQRATNFVLNQTAGKRPFKDLVPFIRESREAAEHQKHLAATGSLGLGVEDAVQGDEDAGKQAQELRFDLLFREVEQKDRQREIQSEKASGDELLTEDAIRQLQEGRKERHARIRESLMQGDVARSESMLSHKHTSVPIDFHPASTPLWDQGLNDTVSVRLQIIDRFVRAGSRALMVVRCRIRSGVLQKALRLANVTDRQSCQVWIDTDGKVATSKETAAGLDTAASADALATASSSATAIVGQALIAENFVLPFRLPTLSSESNKIEQREWPIPAVGEFKEFPLELLEPRCDVEVMDYVKHSCHFPPSSSYMCLHKDHAYLDAAQEEHLIRGPTGEADMLEMPLEMPDSCMLPPAHDALSLLVPSTACNTYIPVPEIRESHPEYCLQQPPPLIQPLVTEPLLPPHIMSLEMPWMEVWHKKRQIADPFQYVDVMPCSFAEAGRGSRLELGGEPLSFMPIGGYARDIPSDTEDDDIPELQIPRPSDEGYQKAVQAMEADVTCDRWRKEEAMEEHLRKLCHDNNTAVRTRLEELNESLDCRHKIFLG